jgi:hypothetical protein
MSSNAALRDDDSALEETIEKFFDGYEGLEATAR